MSGRYDQLFERLSAADEGAFVPFVVIGHPDLETSERVIHALIAGGADALELGIPFSDPIADGPTIQAAATAALAGGVTPDDCFSLLSRVRAAHPDLPLGLLVYANLVVARGLADFYARTAAAGVDSVLVADVPAFEAEPYADTAAEFDVSPVLIAPPGADEVCLSEVARLSRGYTYVVARKGVTGARADMQLAHDQIFSSLRQLGAPPPVLGFGISRPEHVREAIAAGAAGAISGSAVVGLVDRLAGDEATMLSEVEAFVRAMKDATRQP
ncbi:MAG: tryptophan synthase subunit alpha [Deltaproteobacteria bacterium]|jgi:tryptophan synthase alpha chain|nr:tryptophan synthase subunit alpha [Deltaproteobacteria bacterium]MBW2533441.1 tryptophan synthase subunit alpha [Deltaproteobacteria bacterium]